MTKDEAKQKIAELVKKYEGLSARELNQYSHNEEATKLNFIMPLFTALGWDFQNNNEVTAEEKASNGRVDYAFKLKNVTQLCLEAKPLKADINSESYKKQAIDYAYYKAVTWAALTNFEELRLFNAQKKDNFITLTHDKYIQEFDDLWLFSKESFETLLHDNCTIESITDLSAQQIFSEATTYPIIIVLRKGISENSLQYNFSSDNVNFDQSKPLNYSTSIYTSQNALINGIWPPINIDGDLMSKISLNSTKLGYLSERIFVGLQTSADKVYILEKRIIPYTNRTVEYSKSLKQQVEIELALLKPLLSGKDIDRYGYPVPNHLLLFPYKIKDYKAKLISPEEFVSSFSKSWEYLLQNRITLENRENGKMRNENWFAFGRNQNLGIHEQRKLAIPRLVHRLAAVYDHEGKFYLDNVDVGGLILKDKSDSNYLYITALLNSRLLDYYFRRISVPFRGGFRSANRQYLEPLPIHVANFDDPKENAVLIKLINLSSKMIELNKKLAPSLDTYSFENENLTKEIEVTDKEIDTLVYDLYGLTAEERKIVEEEIK